MREDRSFHSSSCAQVDELLLDKEQEKQWKQLGQDAAQLRLQVPLPRPCRLSPAPSPLSLPHPIPPTGRPPLTPFPRPSAAPQLKFTRKAQGLRTGFVLSDVRATIPPLSAGGAAASS